MRRLRNNLRWLTWVAAIAVFGNVLAGTLRHASAWSGAGLDDAVAAHLMCIGGAPAQPEAPSGGQDSDGKTPHCSLCTLLAGFALAVALVFSAISFPSTRIFHPPRFGLPTLADHLSLGGIRSRAPPLPA
jgi:hypothetical protein